jgi:hypothetical protein
MPVGRGSSKVHSPFAHLLSLETVTCRLALTTHCYCSSLDDRARELLRLYYTAILRRLGHGLALTSNGNEPQLTQRHSFSNESSGVALIWGLGRVDISI